MKRLLLVLAAIVLLPGLSLAASAPTAQPDPAANPVLASIQKLGAKFFYLGRRAGMDGWFVVKDGQVQIAYTTLDNKHAIVGALFGESGENITSVQINNLVQTNKEVSDLLAAAQKEQSAMAQVGSPASAAPVQVGSGQIPTTPLSPGERLIGDLSNAATVVIGTPSSPEIMMVMDPRCSHCQATWKSLRSAVIKGSLHLRMIPIATQNSDNERAAAVLLNAADALNVWDKYVGGDKAQLAGTPSEAALAAVRANHVMTDSWKIMDTPYLVYRAKDGKVKILQGEPEKVSALLADLGL